MDYPLLNVSEFTRTIQQHLQRELEMPVLLDNPSSTATFPVCVLSLPLTNPLYHGAAWDISITLEVWSNSQYEGMSIFIAAQEELKALNFTLTNNTPPMYDDITRKRRYGGYFEVRWNAVSNTLEFNK